MTERHLLCCPYERTTDTPPREYKLPARLANAHSLTSKVKELFRLCLAGFKTPEFEVMYVQTRATLQASPSLALQSFFP